MDAVLRAAGVYLLLLLIFRAFGKRSLAQITMFDFVMLLIIAETTQQALLGEDFSLTNAALLIATLFTVDYGFDVVKRKLPWFDRAAEGAPLIVLKDGRPIDERLRECRIDVDDILSAAREGPGLKRLEEIAYAVLEKNGSITVIPKRADGDA
jgi:uncharacterized membrane protein YcaP (DUF421 family)